MISHYSSVNASNGRSRQTASDGRMAALDLIIHNDPTKNSPNPWNQTKKKEAYFGDFRQIKAWKKKEPKNVPENVNGEKNRDGKTVITIICSLFFDSPFFF